MVHIYSGILLSHKKKCTWVSSNEADEHRANYTKLESEKRISYININTEDGSEESMCRAAMEMEADIENRLVDTVGEGESGNMYITVCKIDSQWEFAVWCTELKPSALWLTRGVGWDGRWEGGSRGRGHMFVYGWFMLMYGRNQHNIVKQLTSNEKKLTTTTKKTHPCCYKWHNFLLSRGWIIFHSMG